LGKSSFFEKEKLLKSLKYYFKKKFTGL